MLKGALWLRAPRVPVGVTIEGMYAQFRDARPDMASEHTHVGEIIALGSRDFFVELRLHAVRTPARTGEQWMTFMPLLIGARF